MQDQKGVALLMALFVSLLLTILGLSMTASSIVEYSMSHEFENHEKAIVIADAGLSAVKSSLKGQDLTLKLAAPTVVPQYLSYTEPQPGTYAYRNPLHLLEARNVDFYAPPSATGTRTAKGFLTPAGGTAMGSGRYFAKLSDNKDELPLGLLNNPDVDIDNTLYLRVLGIHRGTPSERATHGGAIKNSVAIIEAMIRRDMSFNLASPFSVYGPNVNPASSNFFDGNSFTIDGFDHTGWTNQEITAGHTHPMGSGQAAIGVINNDPNVGDGSTALNTIYNGLSVQQMDNLEGAPGPYGPSPSLQDDTNDIRTSTNPDAVNIFDANFMASFIAKVTAIADYKYPAATTLSGSNIELGTPANPKVTVALGDLTISGNGTGAGILICKGILNYQGAFNFDGVILVVGTGSVIFGGANKSLIGGLYVSKLLDNGNGTYSFAAPSFTVAGNTNFYFKSGAVKMGLSLLPIKVLLWREITPEIEPAE